MYDLIHIVQDWFHNHFHNILNDYGYWAILVVTFLEGESIVIVAGILAFRGEMDFKLIVLTALAGSFMGDQLYYTLGQKFGTPLLKRFPGLEHRVEWAFRMVRKYETLFILSFRFVYGIRNFSPFVIAMAGVPRLRFAALNFIAALMWSLTFTTAGYFFGKAVKVWFGEFESLTLVVIGAVAVTVAITVWYRNRRFRAKMARQQMAVERALAANAALTGVAGTSVVGTPDLPAAD